MAKMIGVRQQRVQFFFDTDLRTAGAQSSSTNPLDVAQSEKTLFNNTTGNDLSRTNMTASGVFTSDQTFLTFAVRNESQFYGGTSPTDPATSSSNPTGFTSTAAVSIWTVQNSAFQYQIESKVEFEGPVSMTPAGGGAWGFVADSTQPIVTNGEPQAHAIYVLPLPIAVVARQGIQFRLKKFSFQGTTNVSLTGLINGYTGGKIIRAYIDGYNTRDVL